MILNKLVFTGKAMVAGAGLALALTGAISFVVVIPEAMVFASSALGGAGGAILGLSTRA